MIIKGEDIPYFVDQFYVIKNISDSSSIQAGRRVQNSDTSEHSFRETEKPARCENLSVKKSQMLANPAFS